MTKARHPHDGCRDGRGSESIRHQSRSRVTTQNPASLTCDSPSAAEQVASVTSTSCSGSRPTTACDRPEVVRIATVAEPEALSTSDSRSGGHQRQMYCLQRLG